MYTLHARRSLELLLISTLLLVVKGKILRAGGEFSADFNLIDSNTRIKTNVIRTFTTTKSERECSYNCVKEELCISINRHQEHGTCELLDVSKFDNVSLLQRDNGWSHYETDDDQQNVGSVCMQLSPCKEHQVCEDTFSRSNPFKCRCRDGFEGDECKTYKGPGWSKENPSTSSCYLLQKKFKSFPDGDYWFRGRENSTYCERRVDGGYGIWSSYGPCSSTVCKVTGTQERNRTCNNPLPKGGGNDCRELGKSWDENSCRPLPESCTNYFFRDIPHTLKRNNLIGNIPKWHKSFRVQFYFKIDQSKLDIGVYYNIIRISRVLANGQYGRRILEAIIRKQSLYQMVLIIRSFVIEKPYLQTAVTENYDYFKDWIKVDVSQRLTNGKYIYIVKIKDMEIMKRENTFAQDFLNFKVFASDNHNHSPEEGKIKSLMIEGGIVNPA